jgi:(2Fe-2S) ferredoxin
MMRKKGHIKKKLRKKLEARLGPLGEGQIAVVVCVGDDCAGRDQTRATFDRAATHVAELGAERVRVDCAGCLKVCKKGPIAALLPDGSLYRRVTADGIGDWIDGLLAGDGR